MKIIICLTAYSLLSFATNAEPAKPAPKELDCLKGITGFHSHLDKSNGFEFRILEKDGSATVAMNPICLYLVVTNNSSGDDLQCTIVELPKVSAIKNIRFADQAGEIQIEALIDKTTEDGVGQRKDSVTFRIMAPIKERKLPQVIDISADKK